MILFKYREAYEEVGLPLNHPDIHTITLLRPFIAWTRSLVLVTPIVALLTDLNILNKLTPCEGEVDLIFTHPLAAMLDPSLSAPEQLVPLNSEHWPSDAEFYVSFIIIGTRPSLILLFRIMLIASRLGWPAQLTGCTALGLQQQLSKG
jgi:hypothetical protein